MNKYKIKWINTGNTETLRGVTLKNAFYNAGLSMWYASQKYEVLEIQNQ